ncbi:MAG: FAD-dependent oxidoreductase [Anaerolineaceae bacterium]|nr:FAD-dependent oxidoreductase [Anaerolineaceae bacterium]
MNQYQYIIVGAGIAADAAIKGIRRVDKTGSIAIFGKEPYPPYDRPPLSKDLWKGKSEDIIWRTISAQHVEMKLGTEVVSIDPQEKTVKDAQGETYTYNTLLLTTGGTPRKLPFGEGLINYLHSFDEFKALQKVVSQGEHFAVIGGGFIGSEMASVLQMNGKKVSMLFPEKGIGANVFPLEMSQLITKYYVDQGVDVMAGESVVDVKTAQQGIMVKTASQKELVVDGVIAGIGLIPNVALAKGSGINTNRGIVVDEKLRTNYPDIYAAGDVAEFTQPLLGSQIHVEHEDNARMMGKQAGRNMAGANESYEHLSYFYSDIFDLGYLAVGDVNSKLETYIDWREPFKKAVVYYLDSGKVRGVLLWNVANAVREAKELIAEPGPFLESDLQNRLPVD